MKLNDAGIKKYMENPERCVLCGVDGEVVTFSPIIVETPAVTVTQKMHCHSCGGNWVDRYMIHSVGIVD